MERNEMWNIAIDGVTFSVAARTYTDIADIIRLVIWWWENNIIYFMNMLTTQVLIPTGNLWLFIRKYYV